jgi:hypothetical protein
VTRARDVAAPARLAPAAKAKLAVEIVASYAHGRWQLRRSGLRAAVAAQRAVAPRSNGPVDGLVVGRRLGRAVRRTLALLPSDTRCLAQSLTLTRLLAARGVESRLVIGVQPGERFAAHAWVEHAGVPLLPAGADEFEELVTL